MERQELMSVVTPASHPSQTESSNAPVAPAAGTEALASRLGAAVRDRTARVGVIGLGYVGLPLVELFADRGFPVLGFDIDTAKVERLEAGQSYIGHIAPARVAALRD